MLRRVLLTAFALVVAARLSAVETPTQLFEQQLSQAVQSPKVTVVHFWAPWCSNCIHELSGGEWASMIRDNPDVRFIFVTVWSPADGRELLAKYGVGPQENFQLLPHPNTSRRKGEAVSAVLGIPVSWIPTTWIFRQGRQCYSLNYGELRFGMLQQMIKDTTQHW